VTPRELANSICNTLIRERHQAFLVGGCVRDVLLGREPEDYDVSTDATPELVISLFPDAVAVGAQFGVIIVPLDGHKVEVATFRSDIGSADGRHPERVVFSSNPEQDVQRRDLTINGLLMRHDSGEILDFVGGQADLRSGLIRAIGEPARRFAEDKLRMLRAAMQGVEQPPQYHPEGDVWIHTLLMLEGLPAGSSPTLAWGVLLHDVGKPPTFRPVSETGDRIRFNGHVDVGVRLAEGILERLRFSNQDREQILALIANHMRFKDVSRMRASTLKRFIRLPHFDEHLALHRLDCLSSHRHLDAYDFVRRMLEETPTEEMRPVRLLTGNDLQSLGYEPGPLFSKILRSLEDAQLEGLVRSREEAIAFVARHYGETVPGKRRISSASG